MACCDRGERKEFRANYNERPLTRKFYARHEAIPETNIKELAIKYENELDRRIRFDLRKERDAPITENQVYGWLENRDMPYDPKDPAQRKYPRTTDEELRLQADIWKAAQQAYSVVRK